MRDKIVINENPKTYPYLSSAGGFNTLPEPFEECDIKDFWRMFFMYNPQEMEYRQVLVDDVFRACRIYYFHNEAFALTSKNVSNDLYKVYRLGCKHDIEITTLRMFEHRHTCKKCGYTVVVDSSD